MVPRVQPQPSPAPLAINRLTAQNGQAVRCRPDKGGGKMARRFNRTSSRRASSGNGDTEVPMRRRATTVAPEGRLMLTESTTNSRLFVYLVGNWLHRIERERRTLYHGDLDLARVVGVIG